MKKAIAYLLTLSIFIVGISFVVEIENKYLLMLEQLFTIMLPTLIIVYFYQRSMQFNCKNIQDFYALKLPSFASLILSFIILILTPFIVYFVANIFEAWVGVVPEDETILTNPQSNNFAWGLMFYNLIYTSVIPGICEELLFRGAVLGLTRQIIKLPIVQVILNGLLFAAFHQSLEQFFYTFALGMILCSLLIISKSIFCCMLVHILYNFLADLPDIFNPDIFKWANQLLEFFHGNINIFSFTIALMLMFAAFKIYIKFCQNRAYNL